MKDQLIELMKTNLDLVESSIQLYIENQKLRSQVALLKEKYDLARKDKDRFLSNLSQNRNLHHYFFHIPCRCDSVK